ncbi:histidine phosphatase family protein [Microbacterium sp. KUDC0406]|uniref:histidine phosphatase family protein n=1 Tax=Microbacterium sp. KUDC0406 TaxID=2909588 RepID=UPI001F2ED3F8|nr:histidine phosphatase family protein [Microbacterium sp. KUDC0406]UJP11670.1 histidine phosphatase family protein [Microbacterium sp. KUDC0406]
MNLSVVRHGQTEWNTLGRLQGQLDSPLTAQGVEQARAMATELDGLDIGRIVSSPLGRASVTATIIGDRLGLPIEYAEDLAEVHHGELAGLTWDEIDQKHPEIRASRGADRYNWTFPGGESYATARLRARAFLAALDDCTPVLVVAHEMIGRMLRAELLGLTPDEALALRHPHGEILRFESHCHADSEPFMGQ